MKSLTLGGASGTQTLQISGVNVNPNLNVTGGPSNIGANGAIVLTCPGGGCNGGGGPSINAGGTTLSNAGTITVDSASGGSTLSGSYVNTGTLQISGPTTHNNGTLLNQGTIDIATGKVLTSSGSSCGDTGAVVKNDTGGQINATGTGTLNVVNYEQGAGSTSGTLPVQMPCGSLKYVGNGTGAVLANGGFNLSGTMQANQSLTINAASPNTNAVLVSVFVNNGSITMTCPGGGCNGGSGGGPGFNANGNSFTNAGTMTVAAVSGTGTSISGGMTNTGTMQFDQSAGLGGVVVNKGPINIANGVVVTSSGSSCGDTGSSVKNDTGGQINATGTGTLSVINYEQGAGTTSGTAPVQLPCGSVKYTGNGASSVQANGGFSLSGETQSGQSLTVSAASSNTTATLSGAFTNKGSITLTCPGGGCSGGPSGGAGFNAAGNVFTNAGTFTVTAAAGTGTGLGSGGGGTIVNTGTMQFDQSAGLGGVVVNKGPINIANGVVVTSSGSSCGDTGSNVKNDTGGQINATGSGTLSVLNYEQGAGTTSGTAPVQMPCGSLKYTGGGASTVQVNGGVNMTAGNVGSGQTLRILGLVNSPSTFTNAGTIVLDQSTTDPTLNTSGTLTNTGTIATSGPSAKTSSFGGGGTIDQTGASAQVVVPAGTKLNIGGNPLLLHAGTLSGGGTLTGSVENLGGAVAPGASPGILTISGNYMQGAGGRLDIEVAGTGAGQFDKLAVGGNAALGGTLALQPGAGYAASAAAGDSVAFLSYGGTRTNQFAQTTTSPSLACPKQFTATYNDGPKDVSAVVSNIGASCGGGGGGGGGGNPSDPFPIPNTVLGAHPRSVIKIKKGKAKVKFIFSSTVAGATFKCKLDKGAFKSCASPAFYKVKPGKHKFSVQAVGQGGADPTPASFSFKVIRKK